MDNYFRGSDLPVRARVLVLLAEPASRKLLVDSLTAAGYFAETAANPAQALSLLADFAYDVIVLDMDAVQPDDVPFLQNASKLQPGLQIVVLTGRPTLRTAIAAIRVGAADYLVKPIDTPVIVDAIRRSLETLAGLKNQLARLVREAGKGGADADAAAADFFAESRADTHSVVIVPPVRLDRVKRKVTLYDDAERTIDLSRGEASVLACLMSFPNQPVTTDQLARYAWNYSLDPIEAGEMVRPYIFRLRRKLELYADEPEIIVTVRGQGYLFASSRRVLMFGDESLKHSK